MQREPGLATPCSQLDGEHQLGYKVLPKKQSFTLADNPNVFERIMNARGLHEGHGSAGTPVFGIHVIFILRFFEGWGEKNAKH